MGPDTIAILHAIDKVIKAEPSGSSAKIGYIIATT